MRPLLAKITRERECLVIVKAPWQTLTRGNRQNVSVIGPDPPRDASANVVKATELQRRLKTAFGP